LGGTRGTRCARISYPLKMQCVSLHPDGMPPWRVNPRKFCLSGALVFPDQPLIRIPQKNTCHPTLTCPLLHQKRSSSLLKVDSAEGAGLHATRAEWPPAGKTSHPALPLVLRPGLDAARSSKSTRQRRKLLGVACYICPAFAPENVQELPRKGRTLGCAILVICVTRATLCCNDTCWYTCAQSFASFVSATFHSFFLPWGRP
jgi:hypothetical protein